MVDFVSPAKRRKIMQGVKRKDTKPELAVRRHLHQLGFRFRLHRRDLPGKPDIVLPRYSLAIFVNGCFWHQHAGCKDGRLPASNPDYWTPKLKRNVERDLERTLELEELGWRVAVVWECETRDPSLLESVLRAALRHSGSDMPGG